MCILHGISEWYRSMYMYHVHRSSLYEFDSHLSVSQFNDSAKIHVGGLIGRSSATVVMLSLANKMISLWTHSCTFKGSDQ